VSWLLIESITCRDTAAFLSTLILAVPPSGEDLQRHQGNEGAVTGVGGNLGRSRLGKDKIVVDGRLGHAEKKEHEHEKSSNEERGDFGFIRELVEAPEAKAGQGNS
jgi:hypothetical protein